MDIVVTAILGTLALYLFGGLKVLREYERAVYFFLGRSWGAKGPGLIYVPPLFAKTQLVSLRVVALDIPPQDVITRDNISIKVNAVLYMRVKEPFKAVIGVENYLYATSQLAHTTLRSVLGETEMDALLMARESGRPGGSSGAERLASTRRASCRPRRCSARPPTSSARSPPPYSTATCRPSERSPPRTTRRRSSRSRSICSRGSSKRWPVSRPRRRSPNGRREIPSQPRRRRRRPRRSDGRRAHPPGGARAHHPARGGAAGRRAGHRRWADRARAARARQGRRDPGALPASGIARRADARSGRDAGRAAGLAGRPGTAVRSARGRWGARHRRSRARRLDAAGRAAPGEAPLPRPHHLGAEGRRVRIDSTGSGI